MANTTNFGWETPDDTDLVKDGAAAMRTLGNAIDTSLVDLKGGTTDQVLAKNSNTDMDFKWVTSDDANAIQNAIVDAKGDLISATAADTPARLAVGNNGETLVADSSQTTGLRWAANYGFTAGKNKIINGDFNINQRAFSSTTTNGTYGFDRFNLSTSGGTATYSAQTFTPGAAPVAGYEAKNFARLVTSGQTTSSNYAALSQIIENVRILAGQTATISFWAKASTGTPKVGVGVDQYFGSGGSAAVTTAAGDVTISSSWARYSVTVAIPSVSGKTISSANDTGVGVFLFTSAGSALSAYTSIGLQNVTIDLWGVQVEAGSVATAFQTATGTLAGELAACQRYYWRQSASSTAGDYTNFGLGFATTTTNANIVIKTPVTMRVKPTAVEYSTLAIGEGNAVTSAISAVSIVASTSPDQFVAGCTVTGATQYRPYMLFANNSTSAYIGISSEL